MQQESHSPNGAQGVMPSSLIRGYLSQQSVLAIFACRPRVNEETRNTIPSKTTSRELAARYKVSDKTIREIWGRRSWAKVTKPFWSDFERNDRGSKATGSCARKQQASIKSTPDTKPAISMSLQQEQAPASRSY
eukprot:3681065-Rhodomonas_salina.2